MLTFFNVSLLNLSNLKVSSYSIKGGEHAKQPNRFCSFKRNKYGWVEVSEEYPQPLKEALEVWYCNNFILVNNDQLTSKESQ